MKVTMVTVQSLDGKLTHGDNPNVHAWNSDADAEHWKKLRDAAKLIVMGRKTYEAMAPHMNHDGSKLRVVVTSQPEQFAGQAVPGALEFTNEQPAELVKRLESAGYENMLLAGGGVLNGSFLRAGQVTELYTTLEPRLFGQGAELAGTELIDVSLHLESATQLNALGTLLLHYTVA
ncbi:MAG TPA: dihydrofolate reductase [Candidatus Saccharimonadales bacterium]|nr:dihydrofolate reductase [Candidatus Saccharimonadales bacterium]